MRFPALYVVVLGVFFSQEVAFAQSDGGTRGNGEDDIKLLIAEGGIAPTGRFPYMCSLRYQGSHKHFCGATMILPNWIVTAAHCIDTGEDNAPLRPIVYCGIDRLDQNDTDLTFEVRRPKLHRNWRSGDEHHGYDIALLKLDRNASLAPELLPELESGYTRFESGQHLTTLGWGATPSAENSNELRMAQGMEFVPSGTCNEKWWNGTIKEDRMTCAGLEENTVCRGDYGGPLIRIDTPQGNLDQGNAARDLLIGITSFNYGSEKCGEQSRPAVFTRVAYFVDWISETVGEDVTKGRGRAPSVRRLSGPQAERKRLSGLVPRQLAEEMKEALKKDDDRRAKLILKYLDVNATLEETIPAAGRSSILLLHAAAMFDAPKCAQVLIDAGASVKSSTLDYYKMKPLHVCAIFGSLNVSKVLLSGKNGASVNSRDRVDDTAMHKAATRGHVELLEFLIDKTPKRDLFPINNAGASALHMAARAGHVDAAKLLLEKGANSDYKNEDEWTPLHHACYNNHTKIVELFLKDGANEHLEDDIGETPLHKACWSGNTEIVRMLLQYGADPHHREDRGYTAMHHAIWNGHMGPVKLLLNSGVSPDTASYDGWTALHSASRAGRPEIAKLLIKRGASIEAKNNNRDTPLAVAVDYGQFEIVKLLTSKGARVDVISRYVGVAFGADIDGLNGETLLHIASRDGNVEIVKILLRHGADARGTDGYGETPLHKAVENGHYQTVQVLLDAGALKNAVDSRGTPRDGLCDLVNCVTPANVRLKYMVEP